MKILTIQPLYFYFDLENKACPLLYLKLKTLYLKMTVPLCDSSVVAELARSPNLEAQRVAQLGLSMELSVSNISLEKTLCDAACGRPKVSDDDC